MAKERIEIQVLNDPTFHDDTGFSFRILINDKETFVTELNKEQILHIGAILLNASKTFIKQLLIQLN